MTSAVVNVANGMKGLSGVLHALLTTLDYSVIETKSDSIVG